MALLYLIQLYGLLPTSRKSLLPLTSDHKSIQLHLKSQAVTNVAMFHESIATITIVYHNCRLGGLPLGRGLNAHLAVTSVCLWSECPPREEEFMEQDCLNSKLAILLFSNVSDKVLTLLTTYATN